MLSEKLDMFLNLPNVDTITGTVKIQRLGIDVTVQAMSEEKFHELRRMSNLTISGKKQVVTSSKSLNLLIVENQCIDPDFNNTDFLKKAGYKLGRDFILAKILPGEIVDIAQEVLKLSGFSIDEETEEEVKNF